ncbi:MAG: hypothetical protein K2N87_10935, partial [Eubacterium sp.]|nr:hypothetical protein [Eubacterium sp.]
MRKLKKAKQIAAAVLSMVFGVSAAYVPGTVRIQATQNRTYNYSRNYTLNASGADNICAVAQAQIGKTSSDLGYTEAWCADFVADCAQLAGAGSSIPRNGNVGSFYTALCNAGGTVVTTAQKGDIVFYKCTSNSGSCASRPWWHTGIMTDSTISIEGNLNGRVIKTDTRNYVDGNGHRVRDGKITRVFVRPNYTANAAVMVSFGEYTKKYSVGNTNAVLSRTITVENASIRNVSEVGIFLYDSFGNQIASKGEKPVPLGNQINAWYDVNQELGRTLNEGTAYQYKFYAVVNQTKYESPLLFFTTLQNRISVVFSAYSRKYAVGRTNATVSRTIRVSNASIRDVSGVGMILYDANGRQIAAKQETPVPLGNQINAWYDINRELGVILRRNTVYKY